MEQAANPNTVRIAELNDQCRKAIYGGSLVVFTPMVDILPMDERLHLFNKVRDFTDFNEDNDPHGERDFGVIEHRGERYFWKIDYYDLNLEVGSEDPADEHQTRRVLTVMRAEEY